MKLQNLVGKRFERLVVVSRAENNSSNHPMWNCKCDCGNERKVVGGSLRSKVTKSCGCLHKDLLREKIVHRYNRRGKKHILHDKIYNILQRCYNPKTIGYCNYGGRGIEVCKEWRDNPITFIKWALDNGWKKELHIDRIDNDGNYEPNNCRFVTVQENNCNKRNRRENEYIGIYWDKERSKWQVSISVFNKIKHLGRYNDKEEALMIRNQYIIENNLPHKLQEWRG